LLPLLGIFIPRMNNGKEVCLRLLYLAILVSKSKRRGDYLCFFTFFFSKKCTLLGLGLLCCYMCIFNVWLWNKRKGEVWQNLGLWLL
jgi:hypothetical protein